VLQHVAATLLGQVDIEDHHIGTGLGGIKIGLVKKTGCLLAVLDYVDVRMKTGSTDRFPDQVNIGHVVLDHEDVQGAGGLAVVSRGG